MENFIPEALFSMLERRDELSVAERKALESLSWRLRSYGDGDEIIPERSEPTESCLLVEGLAARSRQLANGNRQLTAVHVPGDFVDLHGLLLKVMDHAVMALAPCRMAFAPHSEVRRIAAEFPHLGRLLFMTVAIDAAIQRNWIACMGRMDPLRHIAYLVCEVYCRLDVVGQVKDRAFDFPVTQSEVADLVGLSIVHTNRTIQELRASGHVTWQGNQVIVHDWDGLARLADFDPTYLNLVRRPR